MQSSQGVVQVYDYHAVFISSRGLRGDRLPSREGPGAVVIHRVIHNSGAGSKKPVNS
jgi:hypothetical protein